MPTHFEKTIRSQTVYEGRVITVTQDTAPVSYTHLTLPPNSRV